MTTIFLMLLSALGLSGMPAPTVDYIPDADPGPTIISIKTIDTDGRPVACSVDAVVRSLGGPLKERRYFSPTDGSFERMMVDQVTSPTTVEGTVCGDNPRLSRTVTYTVKPGYDTRLTVTVGPEYGLGSSGALSSGVDAASSDGSSALVGLAWGDLSS